MKKIFYILFLILPLFSIAQIVGVVNNVPLANNIGLDLNHWQYIAITKGLNNEATVYKNGVIVYSGPWSNISYIWSSLTLGCVYYTGDSLFFQGQIDEVRLSNTVRTASEISNYYNSNSTFPSDTSTIGLWHLDNITGSTVSSAVGASGVGNNINVTTGKFGNCFTFNGINSKVDINQTVPTTNMTCEFWIKPTAALSSWAVSFYGINTSGFVVQAITPDCNFPQGTLADGMVAYYPFCGNANDATGNGNNGTVNGATLTTDRFENTNSAYSFDGLNDFISVAHNANQEIFGSQQSSTFSFWYYGYLNLPAEIISKGFHSINVPNYGNKYLAITNDALSNGYTLYDYSTLNSVRCPNGYVIPNQWYHLVFVRGVNMKVYVNGIEVSTDANNAGWTTDYNLVLNNTIMTFGCRNNKDDNNIPFYNLFYNGKIDDIGIWSRALSQEEIANLYNNNLSANSFENTESLITVYPNPTNSFIFVDCSNSIDILGSEIKIDNTLGQEIYRSKLTEQVEKISLGSIATSGLYIIHITDRNGKTISTNKVILQ